MAQKKKVNVEKRHWIFDPPHSHPLILLLLLLYKLRQRDG